MGAGTLDVFSRTRSTRRGFLRRSDLFWLLVLFLFSSGVGRKESNQGLWPPLVSQDQLPTPCVSAPRQPSDPHPSADVEPRAGPRLPPGERDDQGVQALPSLPPPHPFPGPPGGSLVLGTERALDPQACPLGASGQGRETRNANEKEVDQVTLRPRELDSGPKMSDSQHNGFPPSFTR